MYIPLVLINRYIHTWQCIDYYYVARLPTADFHWNLLLCYTKTKYPAFFHTRFIETHQDYWVTIAKTIDAQPVYTIVKRVQLHTHNTHVAWIVHVSTRETCHLAVYQSRSKCDCQHQDTCGHIRGTVTTPCCQTDLQKHLQYNHPYTLFLSFYGWSLQKC